MRVVGIIVLALIASLLTGCGQRPDTDVTSSPQYNFESFAGTVWKSKVKIALADVKLYNGRQESMLLTPRGFDSSHPDYTKPTGLQQIIAVLPIGTRIRIERLMQDNGNWGGVWVTAALDDGKVIRLSDYFLAKNRFVWQGWSDSKEWGVDPEMLERTE